MPSDRPSGRPGATASASLVATLAAAAILAGSEPAAGQSLTGAPFDHWTYRIADALLLRRPELSRHAWLMNRPWRGAEIDSLLLNGGFYEPIRARAEDPRIEEWARLLAAEHRPPIRVGPRLDFRRRIVPSVYDPDGNLVAGADSNSNKVTYRSRVSARYAGDLRRESATFEPAFRPVAFGSGSGQPEHRALLEHDFDLQFLERLAFGWRYVVDTNIRNDPTRRTILGIRGTEAAFEVLDAYATARGGPFWITVGRQALSLGPGRAASPFVSESIPALDQVRLELHADPIRFTAIVAQLSRERPNRRIDESGNTIEGSMPSEGTPVPFDVTRFLYLHRVDWRAGDRLQLALSEAAVVTGIDRGIEVRFANPLVPFFLSQGEDDETDGENVNVVVDVQGIYGGPASSRVYGDLFIQEFFIDARKREEIGNQLAWRVGGEWGDPLGWRGGSVGAEYTRADVFTYLHRGLNTNWTTFGTPIGGMLGPDADQWLVWSDWWVTPTALVTLDLLSRRGGERSVATLESVIDAGNPPFPSGIVQRERRLGAELWGLVPAWGLEGRLRIGRRWVENIANEAGRSEDFWEASLGLTARASFP